MIYVRAYAIDRPTAHRYYGDWGQLNMQDLHASIRRFFADWKEKPMLLVLSDKPVGTRKQVLRKRGEAVSVVFPTTSEGT